MQVEQVGNSLLHKPVLQMKAGDWVELSTMAVDNIKKQILSRTEIEGISHHSNQPIGEPIINLTGSLPADLFDYTGKLNKTAKKGIKTAMKDGRLPKNATIGAFYNHVMQNYEGKLSVIQELYTLLISNLKRTDRLHELPKLSSELFAKFFK